MPAPRNPVRVNLEDTFEHWRKETNALIDIINYYLNSSSGLLEIDSATYTNINVESGTVQNVNIHDSVLEPSSETGFLTVNSGTINDSDIESSIFNNGTVQESLVRNISGDGYWNVDNATLNIANGTESDRIAKGVGGTAELFWDRTNQQLRIFDGSLPGGRIAAIDGMTRDETIGLIIALG